MAALPELVLTGDPYERGVEHGETLADEIQTNASFYVDYFAANGVDEASAREQASTYLADVEAAYPTFFQELRGVADGSSAPIEDVTIITMRHTILYSAYAAGAAESAGDDEAGDVPVEGCTSFGLEPGVTATGHTYVGQNWDWRPPIESAILNVSRDDGPDYLALTEAGNVLGKFGLNECGIGFAVNGLSTAADGEHPFRTPSHVRGRRILDAERFDEALAPIVDEARPTARNYLVGHAAGELINVETTPASCHFSGPDEGILTHANHFEHDVDDALTVATSSLYRGPRLRRLLAAERPVTEERATAALRDHFSAPQSICSHPDDERPEIEHSHTNASVVMDLDEGRLLATNGPPCEASYETYSLQGS